MKEILQTNCLSNKHQECALYLCIASSNVDFTARDVPLIEAGIEAEPEAEHQEEQPQEHPDQELTNFYNTQGKHRFIYPSILLKFKLYASPGSFENPMSLQ